MVRRRLGGRWVGGGWAVGGEAEIQLAFAVGLWFRGFVDSAAKEEEV